MSAPLLSVRGLRIDRGPRTVLHGIDLDLRTGSVVGLIGPNGSGKTTLLSALATGATVTDGEIRCGDVDLTTAKPRIRARHVAFVPQQTRLGFDLTVREIVALGARIGAASGRREHLVERALQQAGCAHLAERPATRLSGGECQLVHIARALAQNTPVLVMDEPTSALDLAHQITVLDLARTHADTSTDRPGGGAVIVSIHDLDLAARFCDRLVLLDAGRIVATGTPAEVLTPDRLARVYGIGVRTSRDPATGAVRVTALSPSLAGAS